ncbi:hypothetical protein BKA82DRAFT_996566 [Pisolithus tinctorius]|uniref:Uncharacterized protein n=1 Tax=Pisolithus tinctorius Marx 270 TaxID=870435 RepID=A0A0C3KJH1_PISTI|nr:hypothetical protein BKA82DRAFT_996566 [Pisolithus tinctorius]KIO09722.1 hypothetical protein M404DRAFT_996566 [Pisolithus tinctorius Marx 270]
MASSFTLTSTLFSDGTWLLHAQTVTRAPVLQGTSPSIGFEFLETWCQHSMIERIVFILFHVASLSVPSRLQRIQSIGLLTEVPPPQSPENKQGYEYVFGAIHTSPVPRA